MAKSVSEAISLGRPSSDIFRSLNILEAIVRHLCKRASPGKRQSAEQKDLAGSGLLLQVNRRCDGTYNKTALADLEVLP